MCLCGASLCSQMHVYGNDDGLVWWKSHVVSSWFGWWGSRDVCMGNELSKFESENEVMSFEPLYDTGRANHGSTLMVSFHNLHCCNHAFPVGQKIHCLESGAVQDGFISFERKCVVF